MEYFGKIKGGKLNGEQAVKCGQMSTIGALQPSAMQFTIPEGVTSWNGEKGDVTYTPPVTSVNGQTGDVIVTGGVTSVNGEVGDVVLDASDVGALPDDTTYVSSFNGQSGAITYTAPVTSVNGSTGAITGLQTTTNLVTSVSSSSTDSQYPSAKLFYDTVGNIETLLAAI